jgi:hypothetical protein
MKFKLSRKLNLANIDKELWPFETEDIGIEDADSFEDAQKKIDSYYNERIGYYRALSEAHKQSKVVKNPESTAKESTYNPSPSPLGPLMPLETGTSSEPPADFK